MVFLSSRRWRARPTRRTFPSRVCTSKARRVAPVALADLGGLFLHELLESVVTEPRDVLAERRARRAVPVEEGPQVRPPGAFYGGRRPRVARRSRRRRLRRSHADRRPHPAAALLPGLEPLLPELRERREAALERLQPESVLHLVEGDDADPAEHLLEALAGRQRRHLQVARKEALVVQLERHDAPVEQIEVARDRDGHRRKVVYIPCAHGSPATPASRHGPPPRERHRESADGPARAGPREGGPPRGGRPVARGAPPGRRRDRVDPGRRRPDPRGERAGRAAPRRERDAGSSCTRTSGARRSPPSPSPPRAGPPDSRRSNTTSRPERADGAAST